MSSLHQHSPSAAEKDARLAQLTAWLASLDLVEVGSLRPASSDASFRRYFRLDVVTALRARLGDTLSIHVTLIPSAATSPFAVEGISFARIGMSGVAALAEIVASVSWTIAVAAESLVP